LIHAATSRGSGSPRIPRAIPPAALLAWSSNWLSRGWKSGADHPGQRHALRDPSLTILRPHRDRCLALCGTVSIAAPGRPTGSRRVQPLTTLSQTPRNSTGSDGTSRSR
jgi:hypothetical protein